MSRCDAALLSGGVAELREQLESEERFKKVLMGLDPRQVKEYVGAQKDFSAQLRSALDGTQREHEDFRRNAEARLAAQADTEQQLRRELSAQSAALGEQRRRLEEQDARAQTLLAQRDEAAEQLRQVRESVEKQGVERMRAQLIAATREGSESTAQLALTRQENKQLKARLAELDTTCTQLSAALAQERERGQAHRLTVDRAVVRVKAHAQTGARESATRLREVAELMSACFAEHETLLDQLMESSTLEPAVPAPQEPPRP